MPGGVPAPRNRVPDASSEQRLAEVRLEAELRGTVAASGVRPAGAPFPVASSETGYYGIPMMKEPSWTWEIPLYFFVGGVAGAAGVIGAVAHYAGADRSLVRDARYIAAAGAVISPALLISDLGRPARFLNMMRVFKPQSPMSVGVWVLVGFSGGSAAAAFSSFAQEHYGEHLTLRALENVGVAASLIFGLPFFNYTGVLIGATSIPVWNVNAGSLPLHFGASGIGAAVGTLDLLGHDESRALQILALGAAAIECWEGFRLETDRRPVIDPLKHGISGTVVRAGGILSGPVPLALRALSSFGDQRQSRKYRRWAGAASILGSLLTRIGWIHAGHVSARDWRLPLGIGRAEK